MTAILKDPSLQGADKRAERQRRVRQIILDIFDFKQMAKLALGPAWDKLTAQQWTEFVSLFSELVARSYTRHVLRLLPERQAIYGGESIGQDRGAVQTTLVDRTTGVQLPVEYWLIRQDQRWAVFDVIVDGVSLALSHRVQFDRIIQRASSDTLLRMLKSKLDKESS